MLFKSPTSDSWASIAPAPGKSIVVADHPCAILRWKLPWANGVSWHRSIIVARWFTAVSGIGLSAIPAFGLAADSRVWFPSTPRVRLAAVPQIHLPTISRVRFSAIPGLGLVTALGFFRRPPV